MQNVLCQSDKRPFRRLSYAVIKLKAFLNTFLWYTTENFDTLRHHLIIRRTAIISLLTHTLGVADMYVRQRLPKEHTIKALIRY